MAVVFEPLVMDDLESDIDYYISQCCQRNIYKESLINCGSLTNFVVYIVQLITVGRGVLGYMPLLLSQSVIHEPCYFPFSRNMCWIYP